MSNVDSSRYQFWAVSICIEHLMQIVLIFDFIFHLHLGCPTAKCRIGTPVILEQNKIERIQVHCHYTICTWIRDQITMDARKKEKSLQLNDGIMWIGVFDSHEYYVILSFQVKSVLIGPCKISFSRTAFINLFNDVCRDGNLKKCLFLGPLPTNYWRATSTGVAALESCPPWQGLEVGGAWTVGSLLNRIRPS